MIVIKNVIIAMNRNKENNNNYNCTTIISIFSLASFIKEIYIFYNIFFAL